MEDTAPGMSATAAPAKRRRLNYACNRCRQRKTRCDASYPKCSSCASAGVACITTDPRRDHIPVQRASTRGQEDPIVISPYEQPGRTPVSQELRSLDSTEGDIQDPDPDEHNNSDPEKPKLPAFPRLRRGDNRLALTQWLDLAFQRLGVPMRLTSRSHQPRPFSGIATECNITIIDRATEILSLEEYSAHYCNSTNRIFPLFAEDTVSRVMHDLPSQTKVDNLDSIVACLVVASVIWSLRKDDFDVARACMSFALANIHVVLSAGDLRAVQICVLMALILRARSDIGAASNIISLGSALAQNLGLHRASSSSETLSESSNSDREVWCWWSLYCVEKIICLELERPSVIRDFDCNQTIPRWGGENAFEQDRLWQGLISLCQLQSHLLEQLSKARSAEEQASSDGDGVKRDKVRTCAEIDSQLLHWASLQRFDLKAFDASYFKPEITPMFSFIATQYQQTLFAVQRNMLVLNPRVIEKEIIRWMPESKSRFRVTRGAKICADIARAVVGIADDIHDGPYQNIAFAEHALLIAIYTFAIIVLRNSSPGMVGSDLQLQARAIELAIKHRSHFDEPAKSNHTAFLWELHQRVAAHVAKLPNQPLEKEPQSFAQLSSVPSWPLQSRPQENQVPLNYQIDDATTNSDDGPGIGFPSSYTMPLYDTSNFDMLDWDSLAYFYDLPL